MRFDELKKISPQELQKIVKEDREKLRQMRFDLPAGKVKDVSKIRQLRKDIARALTLLNTKIKENRG